jgi:hypothetical protein
MLSFKQLFCLAILFAMTFIAQVGAQDSSAETPADIFAAWNRAKREYLVKIEASQKGILEQLESLEEAARDEGELERVKEVVALRRSFEEQGEVAGAIDRKSYDEIRNEAKSAFVKATKESLSKLLKLRQDSIAEIVKNEHEDLLIPVVADAQARWVSAEESFLRESEDARSLINLQLDKAEAKAREKGDLASVESIKRVRDRFLTYGDVPEMVSPIAYNNQLEKAKRKLEDTNKAIVRLLLVNNKDGQAAEVQKRLAEAFDPSLKKSPVQLQQAMNEVGLPEPNPGADSRKAWKNESYKTTIKWIEKDRWEEHEDATGKLVWRYKELKRNAEYIEILLPQRNHIMRLYPKKADLFQNGAWAWVANGRWIE